MRYSIMASRRSFIGAMAALPVGRFALQQPTEPLRPGVRVPAGEARRNQRLKLPGGNLLSIKVSTEDSAGSFFLAEQPSGAKGGPPKHFHLDVDEWWYCLAGEYVVEVGDQRYELKPGDSVLGPRGVPHAFAFVGSAEGRLLVGFTPAGRMERLFRDLDIRGQYSGNGSDADRETARQQYGIVNVGPPLTF